MKNMDPETKKMMDSLGIKMPTVQNAPKVGDKALAEAYEEQTRLVPKKDAARIASISKQMIADGAMPAFISKAHSSVTTILSAQIKQEAEQIYQYVKTKENDNKALSDAASGLWISGNYKHALYLMGKATQENPSDPDNLNNYAAFLTMSGAEQVSIPILLNLNTKFPKNSTILNNLGQAWFGLGETDKAEKYLDSAIMFFSTHSQANYTRCLLEQNKGDKKKATDAMKRSIENSYSKEKDNKLRDLGYELTDKDLRWNFSIPVDALGLEKFHLPKFPMNTDQVYMYEDEWKAFRNECNEKKKIWDDKNQKLYPEQQQQALDEQKRLLAAVKNQQRVGSTVLVPFYHPKAVKKLKYMVDDKDGSIQYKRQKLIEEQRLAEQKVSQLKKQMDEELNKVMKDVFVSTINGDGGVSEEQYCTMYNGVVNKYLPQANMALYKARLEQLEFERKQINNQAYFNMFTMDELTFEIFKNGARSGWLNTLAETQVVFWRCPLKSTKEKKEQTGNKLPDFDDLHCEYNSSLNFFIGSFEMNCSRMTTKFDTDPLKINIKEDLNSGEIIRGAVEVRVQKGIGGVDKGPVRVEIKAGAAVQIEIDRSGITDVIVKAGAAVKAEANLSVDGPKGNETIPSPGVTLIGADVRYGWNSGGAIEGKGILKGLKL
jgi:Flp pilus assembly protein TadD